MVTSTYIRAAARESSEVLVQRGKPEALETGGGKLPDARK